MSMFFMIVGHGKYDRNGNNWDEGVTRFARPFHRTKNEAIECCGKNMNLDKSKCPLVQQVDIVENNGRRQVTLLVKAMGYQQAEDRARAFCKEHFPVKKMARSKQVTRTELFEKEKKPSPMDIFNAGFQALAKANSLFGSDYTFEYYKEGLKKDDRFQSRSSKQFVPRHKDERSESMGKKRNFNRTRDK